MLRHYPTHSYAELKPRPLSCSARIPTGPTKISSTFSTTYSGGHVHYLIGSLKLCPLCRAYKTCQGLHNITPPLVLIILLTAFGIPIVSTTRPKSSETPTIDSSPFSVQMLHTIGYSNLFQDSVFHEPMLASPLF